jgi:uncharacterized Zn finger protein (UPF0148 family)
MADGYCVKCKARKEIANGVEEVMKNGRRAIKGVCPTCGTVMFKILGSKVAICASTEGAGSEPSAVASGTAASASTPPSTGATGPTEPPVQS